MSPKQALFGFAALAALGATPARADLVLSDLIFELQPVINVTGVRSGKRLTFRNSGNVSVELVDGRQCRNGRAQCSDLPGKRLYPGASWSVDLPLGLPASYTLKSAGRTDRRSF